VTIKVKPTTLNRRLEPTGLAKPGETRGLICKGPGLARQESAGRGFGQFWNRTDSFFPSTPGPLAGYPDPLLTLVRRDWKIEGIPFAWRKFRLTGYQSNGIGERRDGSNLSREMHSSN
jgi:hypothetical protein